MAPSILIPDTSSPDLVPVKSLAFREPALLHRSLVERPHKVASAQGSYLYLEDGRKILDACGGAAVAIIGHCNEEVNQATIDQMKMVSYIHTLSYTTDSAEDLARCILEPHEGGFDHGLVKAFFVSSGSEANDAGMKCARQYWFEKDETQRRFYISRRKAYHGNTIGSMSVSTVLGRRIPYEDILLPHVCHVSPADAFHDRLPKESEEEFSARLITEIEELFLRLGPENIISFMAETVVGAASGTMPAPKGYWSGVRAVCDKYGVLLHLDEVMCGMGRTGSYFAFEQENIQPDIVTIGKGLGGGYAPIAGMLINQKIVDVLLRGTSAFNHGHTYQAHPVSCATALAVQKILRRDSMICRVREKGKALETLLRMAFSERTFVADIRGRGFFWSIEFMKDKEKNVPFPKDDAFAARVQLAAFDLGVAVYPGGGTIDGVNGDHVLLAPPYNSSDTELWTLVSTLRNAYDAVEAVYKA